MGVLINAYDMAALNEITIDRTGIGETGEVYLVNKDRIMLTESRFINNAPFKLVVDTKPIQESAKGKEMVGIYPDYRGVPIVGASAYIPELGWALLAEIDKAEAFASLKMMGIVALIAGGICAAVAAGMGILFALSTARPINKLKEAAERFMHGDFKHRVRITRRDEIGALAESFNTMAEVIKNNVEETIYMFAMACEEKDEVTGDHVRRVREYSTAIARELGLTEELAEVIGLSSILHDVGKIKIPESILKKPGPLTPEEREVMKTHTLAGEKILYRESFQTARNIATYHHENWDGTGYPKGLKGAEIPIEARIAKVADVFDALTTKRPYKPAWSEEAAMREIRAMKGKELCPTVVEAFKRAYQEGVISAIRQKYAQG